jgi:hypothetical protein
MVTPEKPRFIVRALAAVLATAGRRPVSRSERISSPFM